MSEQPPEDPVTHASTKITSYVAVAAMAAEAIAQVAAARARERAAADERTARALRAERHAAHGRARLGWAPILDPKLRKRSGMLDAGAVWARAQPWRPDPEAEHASQLAEDRLRELRPDVMDRYDRLRGGGAEPVEAMRRVAPFFDQPPVRTGEPGPNRAALTEEDTARRAGDAQLTLYRGETAVADDPRTARVDEHAAAEDTRARAAAADRSPADVAAEGGYPTPITAASPAAAKTAVSSPASATPARKVTAAAGRTR